MRVSTVAHLAVLIVLPIACGGRLERGEGDGGNGAASSAGAATGATGNGPGTAGARAAGGSMGTGGRNGSGGLGVAGGVGTAGSVGTGGSCACPDIACGPASYPVPYPDGCCFYCAPIVEPCPIVLCGQGQHAELLPGNVCLTCVQDQCQEQLKTYQRFSREVVEKYSSVGCMTDQECAIHWEKNQCAAGCGVAVPASYLDVVEETLDGFAQETCSGMCPVFIPPCDPATDVACVKGRCQLLR